MKYIKFVFVVTLVTWGSAASDTLEDINVYALVRDDHKMRAVLGCMLDMTPCFGNMQRMKDEMIQVMQTKCDQCSPKAKENYQLLDKLVSERYPGQYRALIYKYNQA